MICRIEKTQYGVILSLLLFYSSYVPVSILLAEEFDIDEIKMFDKKRFQTFYSITLAMISDDISRKMDDLNETVSRKSKSYIMP